MKKYNKKTLASAFNVRTKKRKILNRDIKFILLTKTDSGTRIGFSSKLPKITGSTKVYYVRVKPKKYSVGGLRYVRDIGMSKKN